MKQAVIFHNPKAGDSDHDPEELLRMAEKEGILCQYVSIKSKQWRKFDESADLLIAGGGDGCVRRIIEMQLGRTLMETLHPLAILPLGTANNLARTLGIPLNPSEAIASLNRSFIRKLDIGFLDGFRKREFFIEGAGFGVFPSLMRKMKGVDNRSIPTDKRMPLALKYLEQIVLSFKPLRMRISADDVSFEGEYLLAEVMNTRSIGPNLVLAEKADVSDGEFELVLVEASEREKLITYVRALANGELRPYHGSLIRASKVEITSPASWMHVDDKLKLYSGRPLAFANRSQMLSFLSPQSASHPNSSSLLSFQELREIG